MADSMIVIMLEFCKSMDRLIQYLIHIRTSSDNVKLESSHSRHIAAVFIEKSASRIHILSIGQNHPDYSTHQKVGVDGLSLSIHAEDVAISRLRHNFSGKSIRVSILVLRISRGSNGMWYKLSNSQPCIHCVTRMVNRKGYIFNKIYFSTHTGDVACLKIRDLNPIQSKFYRKAVQSTALGSEDLRS